MLLILLLLLIIEFIFSYHGWTIMDIIHNIYEAYNKGITVKLIINPEEIAQSHKKCHPYRHTVLIYNEINKKKNQCILENSCLTVTVRCNTCCY